jgi:hypothetical protein
MEISTLNQFCSNDVTRVGMDKPFSQGDYTYATNGHVIIRIARNNDIPENQKAPKMTALDADFNKSITEWFGIPDIGEISETVCKECNGLGVTFICFECEGGGEVCPQTDFNDYDEQMCMSCDGTGTLSKDKWLKMAKSVYVKEKPADGETCENCNGTGKMFNDKSISINGVLFSDRYLSWLGELPNCEIGPIDEAAPSRFRFDGGDGLIMPRRA